MGFAYPQAPDAGHEVQPAAARKNV